MQNNEFSLCIHEDAVTLSYWTALVLANKLVEMGFNSVSKSMKEYCYSYLERELKHPDNMPNPDFWRGVRLLFKAPSRIQLDVEIMRLNMKGIVVERMGVGSYEYDV